MPPGSPGQNPAPRILFVSAFLTPFIQDDLDVLQRRYPLIALIGHGPRQIVPIVKSVFRSDIVFCWFASVYASLAVLTASVLGKRSVIVIGGVDVAKEPQWNYGIFLSRWKGLLVRTALRRATVVLAVDGSLRDEAKRRANYPGQNIRVLPTGYDAHFWTPSGRKTPGVLTVAVVHDEARARLKGVDTLVGVARSMPRTRFTLIGVKPDVVSLFHPPQNLSCIEPMPRTDLLKYYRKARVYVQPSRREGLPNTLCEAMLCGCIPVASRVGGVPRAVGTSGKLVIPESVEDFVSAIQEALRMKPSAGIKARERIADLFPSTRRTNELVQLIGELSP